MSTVPSTLESSVHILSARPDFKCYPKLYLMSCWPCIPAGTSRYEVPLHLQAHWTRQARACTFELRTYTPNDPSRNNPNIFTPRAWNYADRELFLLCDCAPVIVANGDPQCGIIPWRGQSHALSLAPPPTSLSCELCNTCPTLFLI